MDVFEKREKDISLIIEKTKKGLEKIDLAGGSFCLTVIYPRKKR